MTGAAAPPRFVLMLTRDDLTVTEAPEILTELAEVGLTDIGFKDLGVPAEQLHALTTTIRRGGARVHLEVVSDTAETTLSSAKMARDLQVDFLLGATLIEPVLDVLDEGSATSFFPYVGEIVGHPCLLRGTIDEICDGARRAEAAGADGINLLAYRYDGDVRRLVAAVVEATDLPVLCAGGVNSIARVEELATLGVWGFTAGTAVLDRSIVRGGTLVEQVEAILQAMRA